MSAPWIVLLTTLALVLIATGLKLRDDRQRREQGQPVESPRQWLGIDGDDEFPFDGLRLVRGEGRER